MIFSSKAGEKRIKDDDNMTAPVIDGVDSKLIKTSEDPAPSVLPAQERKNDEPARAIVNEANTPVYKENQASLKKVETLVGALDRAIESAFKKAQTTGVLPDCHVGDMKHAGATAPGHTGTRKTGLIHKFLNGSEITRSFLGSESWDNDIRKELQNLVANRSTQLRRLIDSVVEEQSRKKVEKIVERAKSEIAAARIVVDQAQREVDVARNQTQAAREETRHAREAAEESMNIAQARIKNAEKQIEKTRADTQETIRLAQESVIKAREEAEAEKKTAEVAISQVKQKAMNQLACEMKKAKEEVEAAREATENAIRRSAEEVKKSRMEVEAARNNARVVTAMAQEKVKKAAEEVEEIKRQTQVEISRANNEALSAKEEAGRVLTKSHVTINAAREESRLAKEDAERAIREAEETKALAEEKAYDRFRDEMNRVAEEVETAKKDTLEAIARSRQAKAESEIIKRDSEQAIRKAQEETRRAVEEADTAKQAALEEVAAIKEELRKTRADAEAWIIKANEAITRASREIVSQTREEIARTRNAIEIASRHPATIFEKICEPGTYSSGKIDTRHIAAVLHEIRPPLRSISNFARILLEDEVPDTMTTQELLSILVQQSDMLNSLLDGLADDLNTGPRDFEINRTVVSPNELINDVILDLRDAALEKNILLGSAVPDTLPEVKADEARIKQVLNNLIDNALKFNEGDSTVIVKARLMENELMILVEDHGIGIPEGEVPAVFDEYYRASNHGDREGHGVGLHICKQIVESHGGSIHVESAEGEGSTFGFTLPLARI